MKQIAMGLIIASAFVGATLFATLAAQSSTITSSPTPAGSPASSTPSSPRPSPSPIIPPRDAPAVRSTTPPLSAGAPVPIPTLPDNLWLGGSTAITVPMNIHSQQSFIDVLLNGHPAVFLVDSAVTTTVVDSSSDEGGAANGVMSLQVGDLRFPRIIPARENVLAYTQTYLGAPADGVIGRDLLARYPVQFDFPNRSLTIFRDPKTAATAQQPSALTLPLQVIDGQPALQASLDSQPPVWFILNSGGSFQVQLSLAADSAKHYARVQPSIPYHYASPSSDVNGKMVRGHSLQLGSVTFNQPLVALLPLPSGQPQNQLPGSFGSLMLSKMSLLIDEPAASATIALAPGATLAPIYDPSGITLVARKGSIIVHSVVPGTAADAAHLRSGDEIISINGLAPATLEFARQLLDGNPGQHIVVVYRRWHVDHAATLTLHVII